MKRILQFTIIVVLILTAAIVLAAPATMTADQLNTQILAQLPPWAQWLEIAFATLFGPALIAFIKSERMALDDSTAANGIWQWYKLARAALATLPKMPGVPDVPEDEPETVAPDPNAQRIADLEAQLAALKGNGGVTIN